jgi:hypothetical protein
MSYVRKTRDEYQIYVNYGQGWEHEISEDTMKEAQERRKEYRDNCPQYQTKIVSKRVRIEPQSATE